MNSAVQESLNNMPHEWHYGSNKGWADYSFRLTLRLNCSGIAAKREYRVYHDCPATGRWVVSFPASRFEAATTIADRMEFPKCRNSVDVMNR